MAAFGEVLLKSVETVTRVLFWSSVAIFVYISLTTLYNLFFHPLRRVPGPWLARASRLWARIGNYSGCKSHRIHDAHQRYGKDVSNMQALMVS